MWYIIYHIIFFFMAIKERVLGLVFEILPQGQVVVKMHKYKNLFCVDFLPICDRAFGATLAWFAPPSCRVKSSVCKQIQKMLSLALTPFTLSDVGKSTTTWPSRQALCSHDSCHILNFPPTNSHIAICAAYQHVYRRHGESHVYFSSIVRWLAGCRRYSSNIRVIALLTLLWCNQGCA